MKIRMLILHRHESYPGELAPEVLAVVDEWTLHDNPEWWPAQVDKQKAAVGNDARAWAIVEADLDQDALLAALYPLPTLGAVPITPVSDPT